MNSTIGQILLWAGFLSGSLATVFATANYSRLGIEVGDAADFKSVFVKSVAENSVASEKGLLADDQLVSLDGNAIESASAFGKLLGAIEEKTPAQLVFRRGTVDREISMTPLGPWSTVDWRWYGFSVLACVTGIGFLRMSKNAQAAQTDRTQSSLKQIKGNIADLVVNTERLNKTVSELSPRQIMAFIEEELGDDFRDFADGRDSIVSEHGLEVFARVMTQFASGERSVNRAWSASADGYVQEAAQCIDRALGMLESAKRFLEDAAKQA